MRKCSCHPDVPIRMKKRALQGKLAFLGVVLFFRLDVYFVLPVRGLFEIPDALTKGAPDFREFAGSEYNEYNYQYDYKFRHAESEHVNLRMFYESITFLEKKIKLIYFPRSTAGTDQEVIRHRG